MKLESNKSLLVELWLVGGCPRTWRSSKSEIIYPESLLAFLKIHDVVFILFSHVKTSLDLIAFAFSVTYAVCSCSGLTPRTPFLEGYWIHQKEWKKKLTRIQNSTVSAAFTFLDPTNKNRRRSWPVSTNSTVSAAHTFSLVPYPLLEKRIKLGEVEAVSSSWTNLHYKYQFIQILIDLPYWAWFSQIFIMDF